MRLRIPYSDTTALVREVLPDRTIRWGVFVGFWLLIGTLSAVHWQLLTVMTNPYEWWHLFRIKIALWLAWGGLTPFILWLGHRFRIERGLLPERIVVLAVASIVVTLGYLLIYSELVLGNLILSNMQQQEMGHAGTLGFVFRQHSTYYFLAFWATIGAEHAVAYYRESHERQLRASRLETQLAQVQLAALRNQLQPHFLFNTLHSVVALVRRENNRAAIEMLTGLSDLLRHTLAHLDQNEVPLRDEVDYLNRYVAIERVRFSDRLTLRDSIAPDTLSAYVPSFILQPLVENAIRHGVEKSAGRGIVEVACRRESDELLLEVRDNGVGIGERHADGIGLGATRARLDALYQDRYTLEILSASEGGTTARLTIPFHTYPESLPAPESDDDPHSDR